MRRSQVSRSAAAADPNKLARARPWLRGPAIRGGGRSRFGLVFARRIGLAARAGDANEAAALRAERKRLDAADDGDIAGRLAAHLARLRCAAREWPHARAHCPLTNESRARAHCKIVTPVRRSRRESGHAPNAKTPLRCAQTEDSDDETRASARARLEFRQVRRNGVAFACSGQSAPAAAQWRKRAPPTLPAAGKGLRARSLACAHANAVALIIIQWLPFGRRCVGCAA